VLTLYAFSSDNWRRPDEEVGALMTLFRRCLAAEVPRCIEHGIRLTVLGRRDRLAADLVRSIEAAEEATRDGSAMRLRIAIDYSSRDTIVRAASGFTRRMASREDFALAMARAVHDPGDTPDVDLLIRTGGEQRLSDFLLWECAYAELVFLRRMWPDFGDADFESAIADFGARERRFGGLRQAAV
jgi:undecaprenyl diphosphate synthase